MKRSRPRHPARHGRQEPAMSDNSAATVIGAPTSAGTPDEPLAPSSSGGPAKGSEPGSTWVGSASGALPPADDTAAPAAGAGRAAGLFAASQPIGTLSPGTVLSSTF